MKVRWFKRAAADAEEAVSFYEDRGPGVGLEFIERLRGAVSSIRDDPTRYPHWPDMPETLGVRRYRLSKFPYYVGYRVHDDEVVVVVVAHARRRPGFWVGRVR